MPDNFITNTLKVLRQKKAALTRTRYGNPAAAVRIIAIMGPYGKTTTAHLLSELLQESGRKTALWLNEDTKNAESQIASQLQRRLKQAKQEGAQYMIVEADSQLVADHALTPDMVDTIILTGDAPQSAEFLRHGANYVVVPDDFKKESIDVSDHQAISYGDSEAAEARIEAVRLYKKGTELHITFDGHTPISVASYLVGKANVYNIAAAIAAAYVLGVELSSVQEGIARLESVPSNYQYMPGSQLHTTVVDAARFDRSVALVLETAKQLAKRRLIVALEASQLSDETLEQVKKQADRLILVSSTNIALPGVETVSSCDEAWLIAHRGAKQDDTVLLLGRGFSSVLTEESSEKET